MRFRVIPDVLWCDEKLHQRQYTSMMKVPHRFFPKKWYGTSNLTISVFICNAFGLTLLYRNKSDLYALLVMNHQMCTLFNTAIDAYVFPKFIPTTVGKLETDLPTGVWVPEPLMAPFGCAIIMDVVGGQRCSKYMDGVRAFVKFRKKISRTHKGLFWSNNVPHHLI